MAAKVKHSETVQGYYRKKAKATQAARDARKLGLGAKVRTCDWGDRKYVTYIWLKR